MIQIKEQIIEVKDYLTKSNLPASNYVINPYVGCPHACKYCYACFMKRFTGHPEEWGTFLDIKHCSKPISIKKLTHRSVFLSSVTDCYNPLEEKYQVTRSILEQLVDIDCFLGISTKSSLILRDMDLLKKCKNLKVSFSINTMDEAFKNDMDHADTIENRTHALRTLHENGIYTILFMSPIFPEITDFREIIEATKSFVDEFWFENLNLRGGYKSKILTYIQEKYPEYFPLYQDIYVRGNTEYWPALANQIDSFCREQNIRYINYFYHKELVQKRKNTIRNFD